MEKKWRRIGKGEMLPTSSIIRPINGGLPNIAGSHVMVGQDCYYLSVDDACELLKDLPLETETETKKRNEATIIKKLIGLVKETELIGEENRTSLLDWLEKQGEKESDPRYKYLKELLRADDIYQMAMNDAMVQEAKTKAIDALSKLEIGNLLELEKQGEQKPAWSEEDEDMLKSIIATCELAEQERDSSPARHLFEMQSNWLESLKERYTWKPSDEQMDALETAVSSLQSTALESLYQDLKGYE